MFDRSDSPARLRRPSLLMRAARLALADYRRERDLLRLMPQGVPMTDALLWLRAAEARAEADRIAGSGLWSATRHVDLLTALLFELALARRPDA
jgi:hypothetical protein